MVVASLYHKTVEGAQGFIKSNVLQGLQAEFGEVIVYTDPPCIDCTWPVQNDEAVRKELDVLGCCKVAERNDADWKKSEITIQQTGVFLLDDVDAPESACSRAIIAMKYIDSDRWTGRIPREMHMLKGFEVKGQDIIRVCIGANRLIWSKKTEPCEHLCVMRPGNICWPAFYMCWDDGLRVTVEAPIDRPPEFQAIYFRLTKENKDQLVHSDRIEAPHFDGGDEFTHIGKFVAGLASAWYVGSGEYRVEDEVLERARQNILQKASDDNADVESRKPKTYTVYSNK